jgi:hypothetical protein
MLPRTKNHTPRQTICDYKLCIAECRSYSETVIELAPAQIKKLQSEFPGLLWSNDKPSAEAMATALLCSAQTLPIFSLVREAGFHETRAFWNSQKNGLSKSMEAGLGNFIDLIIDSTHEASKLLAA